MTNYGEPKIAWGYPIDRLFSRSLVITEFIEAVTKLKPHAFFMTCMQNRDLLGVLPMSNLKSGEHMKQASVMPTTRN